MELIVFWTICGFVASTIAHAKGGSGGKGFLVGAILGPLGIIIALFMGSEAGKVGRQVADGEMKSCPMCAEAILPAALICKHCGHQFDPDAIAIRLSKKVQ